MFPNIRIADGRSVQVAEVRIDETYAGWLTDRRSPAVARIVLDKLPDQAEATFTPFGAIVVPPKLSRFGQRGVALPPWAVFALLLDLNHPPDDADGTGLVGIVLVNDPFRKPLLELLGVAFADLKWDEAVPFSW